MKKPLVKNPKQQSLKVSPQIFGIKQLKSPCKTTSTKNVGKYYRSSSDYLHFFRLPLVLSQLLYLVLVVNNVYIFKKLRIYTCDVILPMFLSRIYSRSNNFSSFSSHNREESSSGDSDVESKDLDLPPRDPVHLATDKKFDENYSSIKELGK